MKHSIHQFVSTFSPRDAIGNIVLSIREILRDAGYNSEIYAETIHSEMRSEAISHTQYNKKNSNDLLIYHHGFASNLVDYLLSLPNKLVLIYHNITPSHFFIGVDEGTLTGSIRGREQLKQLKNKVEIGLTFSEYSRAELIQNGFKNTLVLPAILNLNKKQAKQNISLNNKFNNSVVILSVGRFVSHKKIEDIIKIFAYYNTCINSKSQLLLVGNYVSTDPYYQWLQQIIQFLELKNVNFQGNVPDDELPSYYENSDVYISMSEHEGFGIPLIESMHYNLPIIAYDSSAVPSTLGNAGILIKEKKFEEIAEIIQLIIEDKNLRNEIIDGQKNRLKSLDPNITRKKFLDCIEALISSN